MERRWIALAALAIGVAWLLVFVAGRIDDRERIVDVGSTVLIPLAPLGPRDLSRGDRIELNYALPEAESALRAGTWPTQGAMRIELNASGIITNVTIDGPAAEAGVLLNYRYASDGYWPSDQPKLTFGDGFFLISDERAADYLVARYAILKVDDGGSSVVIGLADGDAVSIQPIR